MKILLVESESAEAARLLSVLKEGGVSAIVAPDLKAATSALVLDHMQVIVIDLSGPDDSVVEWVGKLRAKTASLAPYILLRTGDVGDDYLRRAYDAGIQGDLRKSASAPLLFARLHSANRWLTWERTAQRGEPSRDTGVHSIIGAASARASIPLSLSDVPVRASMPGFAAPKISIAPSRASMPVAQVQSSDPAHEDLIKTFRSAAWCNAASTIQSGMSKFLTLPIGSGEVVEGAAMHHGAAITLSNVQSHLELRIAVGVDEITAQRLAVHMFGEGSEELAPDMLGEIVNISMGVMKTALGQDNLPFTAGLPEAISADQVLRPLVTYKYQDIFSLRANDAVINLHLGLRIKPNVFVPITALMEGMVVAKDVYNMRGLLLLSTGTRLSLSMIEKIRTSLAPNSLVEVMSK